jgi:hypothetical protein
MPANRPSRGEEVVLKDVAEAVEVAEEKNGPWPELDEPVFDRIPRGSDLAERVTLWTMVGLLGAITIYAIAANDRKLLVTILALAVGTLLRLAGLRRKTDRQTQGRHKTDTQKDRHGEEVHDPSPKKRLSKRRRPG